MTENHLIKPRRRWYSKSGQVLLAFAAIAAFFLLTGHRALGRVGSSSNESTRRAP